MTKPRVEWIGLLLAVLLAVAVIAWPDSRDADPLRRGRREVVFWHFWGGADRAVVEKIVGRFNASQNRHYVRAIAMPGNNLDLKLFLAVTGGDPPDVVNQDDPILADWAARDALHAIDDLATADEMRRLRQWMFPAAWRLGAYDGKLYGLCNGLDVRALYYNRTLLAEHGLKPPKKLRDLDRIAAAISPPGQVRYDRFGYLPDARRLWAWGIVFGGRFYDPVREQPTADDPRIVAALEWMTGFRQRYGARTLQAFRQGDQSLPGSAFPLLPLSDDSPHGRYAVLMDGQWRVRDIAATQEDRRRRGLPVAEYGVCPLPPPPGGQSDAGWVNGNYFLCPRGAPNPEGAWEFMKFWCGFDGHEAEAAAACAAGGWIPVSQQVVVRSEFQDFLQRRPLFGEFVRLAGSPNQIPIPVTRGSEMFNREIKQVGERALSRDSSPPPADLLKAANQRIAQRMQELRRAESN